MDLLLTYSIDALAIFLMGLSFRHAKRRQAALLAALTAPIVSLGIAASVGVFSGFIRLVLR
jgi:NhaP-type Na+/H+ or K+/H+ antiporter